MTDSVREYDDSVLRRLHSQYAGGKLHKGQAITAPSASIPTKYQTLVTSNADRKGFGAQSKRFNYELNARAMNFSQKPVDHQSLVQGASGLHKDDKPSPANYLGHTVFEKQMPSFGKKGTGGFASKSRRIGKVHVNHCPGAGKYALPSLLQSRQDYNTASTTSSFALPIARQLDKVSAQPAPNAYDPLKSRPLVSKSNNVAASAAFKSTSKRDTLNQKITTFKVSPCQYNPNDLATRADKKIIVSSFKSTSSRDMMKSPNANPGPGAYRPHEEVEPQARTIYPRKHYLCISAPAMALPPPVDNPGPGAYELVNYEGAAKHYMSSSAFVSTTGRWQNSSKMAALVPGPAQYRPTQQGKQSFIYNASGKWL